MRPHLNRVRCIFIFQIRAQAASDILSRGIAGLPRGTGAITHVVLAASSIPTLDEMLAASFAAWLAAGGAGSSAECGSLCAICRACPRRVQSGQNRAGVFH